MMKVILLLVWNTEMKICLTNCVKDQCLSGSNKTRLVKEQISKPNKTKSTAQKMKFSTKDFFSKCELIRRKLRTADLVIFTEEILSGKLPFLCSGVAEKVSATI